MNDALLFFLIPRGWCSFALAYACMFTEVRLCEAKGGGGGGRRGPVSWLGLVSNKRGSVVVFKKKKKNRKEKKIIIFIPPTSLPPSLPPFLCTQVSRGSPFSGVDESSWAPGFRQKVPSDHKQTFRWITSKALPQLLALSYLRKIGSLRAKKMTLFTLAGALISASHVCCVAVLSAYQQTTWAALHNRSFEGFLWLKKKKGDRKREDNNNKNRVKKYTHTRTHKHIQLLFPTHTNGHDGSSFLSRPLRSPLLIGFSLFRTN